MLKKEYPAISLLNTSLTPELISPVKILAILVVLELVTMGILLFASLETLAYYLAILLAPLFIILLPIEPTIGLAAMVITTGLDYFGVIASGTSAQYQRFTFFHLAMFLTLISTVMNLIIRRRTTIPTVDIWAPVLAFLVMYAISFSRTSQYMVEDALFTIARVFILATVIFTIVMIIDTKPKLLGIVAILVLVPVVLSGMSLYQTFNEGTFFAPIVIKVANTLGLPVFRASATFTNPNGLACFIMVGSVLGFAAMFARDLSAFVRLLIILCVIVANLGLIASFSRGGWLSTMVALSIVVALHRKWSYFWYFGLFLFLCLIIISIKVPHLWEVVFERFGSIFTAEDDASSSGRIALIKTSIWMWMDHPLFGIGLRSFPAYFDDYIDPSMPRILSEIREAHTIQAEILAEFGLIGLTIAAWLFFTVLFTGLKSIRNVRNDLLRCIQIGLVSLYIGYIVNFTFATDITNNIFWMVVGLIYALPHVDKGLSRREISREYGAPDPPALSEQPV